MTTGGGGTEDNSIVREKFKDLISLLTAGNFSAQESVKCSPCGSDNWAVIM